MRIVLTTATILTLAGCTGEFNRPLGAEIDSGAFGNATMNNMLVQSGELSPTQALGQRFASEVPTTITFAFNSSQLDGAAMAVLDRQADWIRQFPELRFSVYGHTDLVGSAAYNQALGRRRAEAAVAYLGARGISRARLEALVSFGKTQPVIPTPGPEERNRRTVTEVSGFVDGDGMLLNGKYAAVIFREYVEGATRIHPANVAIATEVAPAP